MSRTVRFTTVRDGKEATVDVFPLVSEKIIEEKDFYVLRLAKAVTYEHMRTLRSEWESSNIEKPILILTQGETLERIEIIEE